jgi:hypothetical protein
MLTHVRIRDAIFIAFSCHERTVAPGAAGSSSSVPADGQSPKLPANPPSGKRLDRPDGSCAARSGAHAGSLRAVDMLLKSLKGSSTRDGAAESFKDLNLSIRPAGSLQMPLGY